MHDQPLGLSLPYLLCSHSTTANQLEPSSSCCHIGLIPNETNINCPGMSTEDIFVKNRHSSIPAQLKNLTAKRVCGRGLKIPLMDDGDQQPHQIYLQPKYESFYQDHTTQVCILSTSVRDRWWRTNSQKNMTTKVRLALFIRPLGSKTQSAPLQSK